MIPRQHFETYVKELTSKGLQTFVEQILKKLWNVAKETENNYDWNLAAASRLNRITLV